MDLTTQVAKHARGIFFGDNWTSSGFQQHLADVTWQQATTKVYSFNTIAALLFHVSYYVSELVKMLRGAPLQARDKLSWETPPIQSQQDWEALVNKTFTDAGQLVQLIEKMPEQQLWQYLGEEKYGHFYYNIHGIIEHSHYHLGQIVLIFKLLQQQ